MRSFATTGRRPSPHATHTPDGDQPRMMRRGHSDGNAAKWSTPRWSGTRSGSVGDGPHGPGSLPRLDGAHVAVDASRFCTGSGHAGLHRLVGRVLGPFGDDSVYSSRTSSTALKYRGSLVNMNHCSCERRTRSVTDSGSPFGFDQMISARRMRSSWSMQPMA